MAKEKIILYNKIDYESYLLWEGECPINGYRTALASDVPLTGLPKTLTQKVPAVCLVNSGDLYCFSYFMADLHRKDGEFFDRQPLIVRFDHKNETAIAGIVHHLRSDNGNRSSYDPTVTSGLLTVVNGSGLVQCDNYWIRQTRGTFQDFAISMPQEQKAFQRSVSLLDQQFK